MWSSFLDHDHYGKEALSTFRAKKKRAAANDPPFFELSQPAENVLTL